MARDRLNICWFRRDLRLHDHTALYHAMQANLPILPLFIFDTKILDDLEDQDDSRVDFIYQTVADMHQTLNGYGTGMHVYHGEPEKIFESLVEKYDIDTVFVSNDYELYAIERDRRVNKILSDAGVEMRTFKDQVMFEKGEVVKDDGEPYKVFTPYSRVWKSRLETDRPRELKIDLKKANLYEGSYPAFPALEKLGFKKGRFEIPSGSYQQESYKDYQRERNFPAVQGTSRLGIHLRFGTISIRQLVEKAEKESETFLNELIWREFYMMVLWHFPQVAKGNAFKKEYDLIQWRNNEKEFQLWCKGRTGYPIVDAGMRQLNSTGYMHNRVRMITASFLSKHLLIDWRWGEAYFARLLLDYEFASNNGGWQWSVGSGCDAAPYFRIFNPYLQEKKFDPDQRYIRHWVEEFGTDAYPEPIIAHEDARKRCLEVFGRAVRRA